MKEKIQNACFACLKCGEVRIKEGEIKTAAMCAAVILCRR
ncbi:hypothetical protein [Vibrio cholerae]|nr:hypothetical protein VCHC43B1_2576 [Vibrio cholerae HC-43B1]CFW00976.1 hypothetical protein [Vibrio cholerae]CPR29093.1 hypothetical protein [Vibrio cholerae]CPR29094.1 hypothetical protein [Vibrio cholerae]CQB50387.1 hypothetical protein [Vibrio cholerae]